MFLTDHLPSRPYDYYVIGAGPAGIALSIELAKANRTVLVFETGTVTEPRDDMPNAVNYGHFRNGWWDSSARWAAPRGCGRAGAPRLWRWISTIRPPAFGGRKSDVLSRTFHPRCRDAAGARSPTRDAVRVHARHWRSALVDKALGSIGANASRSAVSSVACVASGRHRSN